MVAIQLRKLFPIRSTAAGYPAMLRLPEKPTADNGTVRFSEPSGLIRCAGAGDESQEYPSK